MSLPVKTWVPGKEWNSEWKKYQGYRMLFSMIVFIYTVSKALMTTIFLLRLLCPSYSWQVSQTFLRMLRVCEWYGTLHGMGLVRYMYFHAHCYASVEMVHNLDNEDLPGMGWVLAKMLRTVLNSPAFYTILPVISGSCYECFESRVGGDLLVVLLQWESREKA